MSRFPGHIIKLPANTPSQSSAPGVWTLKDQLVAQRNNQWPFQRDPDFRYTTLLLQGNVPNTTGPQAMNLPLAYNSDASSNNFLITPNGDVSPRPFSPYMGETYSAFFDGNGDLVTVSGGMPSGQGTAFTLECWVNPDNLNDYRTITRSAAGGTLDFGIQSSGQVSLANTGVVAIATTPTGMVRAGVWTHIALTRTTGNLYTIYVNGLPCASGTNSTSMTANTTIGQHQSTASQSFSGYITNFRVCNALVYTGQFAPSDAPLTATSQGATSCQLLCLQSNRFIDNSGNNRTVTRGGDCRITDNSPFVSADFTTGSGYFDGTNDSLAISATNAFAYGTAAFTIEAWVYSTGPGATRRIYHQMNTGSNQFTLLQTSANKINAFINLSGVTVCDIVSVNNLQAFAWNHVAFVRSGSNFALFINGIREGTASSASSAPDPGATVYIGTLDTSDFWLGYISNLRSVKGTAIYDHTQTSIPIPTAPLTAIPGTSLLTLQTRAPSQNHGFIDSSPNEFIVTRNGNVSQGTFSPFSPTGWSNYFDGDGDYLSVPVNSTYGLDTSNFTFECWYFASSLSAGNIIAWGSETNGYASVRLQLISTGYELLMSTGGSWAVNTTITAYVPPIATWTHLAFIRSGTSVQLFQNGTLIFSGSVSGSLQQGSNNWIGKLPVGGGTNFAFNGYISNFRFIKGQALYSGATVGVNYFTPSTAPLTATAVGNTGSGAASSITGSVLLLTCQSNRFRDAGPASTAITVNGNPSVQAFSPFAPANSVSPLVTGGSGYFDGTTDYLTAPASNIADVAAGQAFTFECWFYTTSTAAQTIIKGAANGFLVDFSSSFIGYGKAAVAYIINVATSIVPNQWNHIAVSRNTSNQSRMWLNGVSIGSTNSDNYSFNNVITYIGEDPTPLNYMVGYISSLRFVKGTALYDPSSASNIPVPTAPPTAIPGTSLLLNFTGGGIVDATGKNVIETVQNAQLNTKVVKWSGQGSMQFDGTGDWVIAPSNPHLNFGGANFTIEFWANFSASVAGTGYALVTKANSAFTPAASFAVWRNASNKLRFIFSADGGTSNIAIYDTVNNFTPTTGVWYYIAVTRSGSTFKIFIDGVEQTVTTTLSGTATSSSAIFNSTTPIYVGAFSDNTFLFTGYIADLRITNGVARTVNSLPPGPFPIG